MKIIGLEFKSISLQKFYPSKKEVELGILFSDGAEQSVSKVVSVSDPERATEQLVSDIKHMVKNAHKESGDQQLTDSFINLVVKEEDRLFNDIPQFLTRIHRHLEQIESKKDADGYLDLIREIKNLKLEFD